MDACLLFLAGDFHRSSGGHRHLPRPKLCKPPQHSIVRPFFLSRVTRYLVLVLSSLSTTALYAKSPKNNSFGPVRNFRERGWIAFLEIIGPSLFMDSVPGRLSLATHQPGGPALWRSAWLNLRRSCSVVRRGQSRQILSAVRYSTVQYRRTVHPPGDALASHPAANRDPATCLQEHERHPIPSHSIPLLRKQWHNPPQGSSGRGANLLCIAVQCSATCLMSRNAPFRSVSPLSLGSGTFWGTHSHTDRGKSLSGSSREEWKKADGWGHVASG